ncbi:MAG: VWA domain-containing protein [Deltaproteobacteria bacterium]|nr:VWA domain-containing protein [Deltaproteobacteria bacterium]
MSGSELHFFHGDWWYLVPVGLAVVLAAFLWLSLWRARMFRRLADPALAPLLVRSSPSRRAVRRVVRVLGLALLGIAALRPQFGLEEIPMSGKGIDLAVVLDISNSMLVPDIAPDRLTGSVMEVSDLLDRMEGGRVSLVPFAGLAYIQTPLTSDFGALRMFLRSLSPADVPIPGTAIGKALSVALESLVGPQGRPDSKEASAEEVEVKPFSGSKHKAVLLITDGEDHGSAPMEVATRAQNLGIRIYTVGVGSDVGDLVPKIDDSGKETGDKVTDPDSGDLVVSRLNRELLEDIAQLTGGKYFHYSGSPLAAEIYRDIEQLEKQEYASRLEELRTDRFQFLLLPAFLLLFAELLLPRNRRDP